MTQTCDWCNKPFDNKRNKRFCSTACRNRWIAQTRKSTPESHPKWKEGRCLDSSGYVRIRCEDSHRSDGYVLEHILVMERQLGRKLTIGEQVHHVNGDKADNRIENLVVLTRSEHMSLHAKAKIADGTLRRDEKGRFRGKQD